ncbi:DMT family transporter [Alphaproteobacteria bacterium]|nr:DMT family transporter [Alphaproteobacteria bacterium]
MVNNFNQYPIVLRAIILMIASTLLFTGMQVTVRLVSDDIHPFEIAFFRNFFGLIIVLPLLYRSGLKSLKTDKINLHATRGVLQTCGMLLFFTALTITPLAQNVALSFTAPLFTVLLAVLILRERSDYQRWFCLFSGLFGAWIVIRPGFSDINLGSVLVLLSSVMWAGSMVIIKYLSKTESSLTLTIYMGLFMAPLSLIPSIFIWTWPDLENLFLLILIGFFGGVGHLALASAFKLGDTGSVLPFDFLRLVWAALLGFFFFREIPDIWTYVGGILIFLSASYLAIKESKRRLI